MECLGLSSLLFNSEYASLGESHATVLYKWKGYLCISEANDRLFRYTTVVDFLLSGFSTARLEKKIFALLSWLVF